MRRHPWKPCLLLVCLCGALGCAPTETGNPPLSSRVAITLQTSAPDQVAIAPDSGATTVESFWLGVGRLRYAECSGGFVDLVTGPQAMELVAGLNTRPLAELPKGSYCDVQLVLSPVADAGAPPELATYGLFVTGSLSSKARFEVLAGDLPATRTLASGSLERVANSPPLLLSVDVAKLLTPLSLPETAPDASGVVRADRSGVTGDPQNFGEQLGAAYSLHEDRNGNGRVDPDEPDLLTPP